MSCRWCLLVCLREVAVEIALKERTPVFEWYRRAKSAGRLDALLVFFMDPSVCGPCVKYFEHAGHAVTWALRLQLDGGHIVGMWDASGFDWMAA